jgi:hydrogenase-4 membrane subunit HyfE
MPSFVVNFMSSSVTVPSWMILALIGVVGMVMAYRSQKNEIAAIRAITSCANETSKLFQRYGLYRFWAYVLLMVILIMSQIPNQSEPIVIKFTNPLESAPGQKDLTEESSEVLPLDTYEWEVIGSEA